MRKEEFERRAAKMRADYAAAATAAKTPTPTIRSTATASVAKVRPVLAIPGVPTAAPYSLLRDVWKPSHTKMLLAALGEVHPIVMRTVRALGSQQVRFDGLIYLHGDGVPDMAASTTGLPEALRLFDLLIRTSEQRGADVSVTKLTTVKLDGETVVIRMREGSERRRKEVGKYGLPQNEYFPTGQHWLTVAGEDGSRLKTLVREERDIDEFLHKLRRHTARLPKKREQQEKRERARKEEHERWQAEWRRKEDRQRQWNEQQKRFDQVFADVEEWTKAERIRAYAAAFEASHIAANGEITVSSPVEGWIRWLNWYAEHLDPLTRPTGPSVRPEEPAAD